MPLFKRSDGYLVKDADPFAKMMPYIMSSRTDSQNQMTESFECDPMDRYIEQKRVQNITVTYMDILMAAIVRTIKLRPGINRFINNGKIYQRYKIYISLVIHRTLRGDGDETSVKFEFIGDENIFKVMQIVRDKIEETMKSKTNETDQVVDKIMAAPGFLVRFIVNMLKWMDKHNILPKQIIEASPFHTSAFVTNLKSIGLGAIFHHVYEFGTTGIFFSLGKEKMEVVSDKKGNVSAKKMIDFGLVSDERFSDGLYFSKTMKIFRRFVKNPELLEKEIDENEQ